ncbi:MAG: hypothetical protein JWQ83_1722 [Lacunisphaera sp.]|nr:hypothetical protein [Lacunisphaera sp.]
MEVNGLMGAVNLGDAKIEDRLDLAVGELRADQTLPRDLRARVVGGYSFSRVVRKSRSPAERTAATEQTARDLIREFPSEPQGYESLLNVALESDDEKYRNLLFFLWQSSAPTVVKLRVRTRMDRHFLKGEKISELLADAGEEKLAKNLTPGRPTILYAWSAGNAASMAIEEALKLRALAQANVIGICLDRDIPAARAAAQPAHLPGTLYYDEHGSGGKLATRLKIDGAPALILVGADGRIVDTRGEYAFAAKVTQLGL